MVPSETYTCTICAKSFEKRTSQLRHISYCRKSRSRGRSRKKACSACTKAKTHCDAAAPSCSRCAEKNLSCHYDRPRRAVSGGTAVDPSGSSDDSSSALEGTSTLPFDLPSETGIQLIEASPSGAANPFPSSLEEASGSLSTFPEVFDTSSSFSSSLQMQDSRSPLRLPSTVPAGYLDADVENILSMPLQPRAPRGFFPRVSPRTRPLSLNRKFMIATMRSYPFSMLPGRGQNLPSFIHPQCLSYGSGSRGDGSDGGAGAVVRRRALFTPLENCLAIVQMWSVKNEANSALIWKTIRLEQERLSAECSCYDDWTIVASLQAITVYCLLRISEQNDEHVDFDLELIRTMVKFAQRTQGIGARYSRAPDGGNPSWEAWVLVESLRRTLTVLFLLNLIFDYTSILHPHICDGSQLLRIPLPCGRNMWHARSRPKWEMEYTLNVAGKELTYGDLVNGQSRKDRTLEAWFEQLDDFGTLVMAAANLGDG